MHRVSVSHVYKTMVLALVSIFFSALPSAVLEQRLANRSEQRVSLIFDCKNNYSGVNQPIDDFINSSKACIGRSDSVGTCAESMRA